jgi:acyl-coenzyme A thioesterase PaaI-like protein
VHNSTDFLRPVVDGRVDVVASPILQGRVQQLWSVELTRHDDKKLIAQGRLRLQNVPMPRTEA